jgi:proton-dependent oligopeptide transporter, POT family
MALPSPSQANGSNARSAAAERGHPAGLYTLFGAEAWERFSYYGMRALLVLYLTKAVGMTRDNALELYGIYTGLVYITPLLGGYLADRFLGRRKAVLIGGTVMALGHLAMAVPSLLHLALALLIIGNGFFKPNISTMVGDLYDDGDPRRDGAFTIFYMGINLGALWAPILVGTLGEKAGWHVGFSLAAFGMLAGLAQFGWGQKNLGESGLPPGRATVKVSVPQQGAFRDGIAELSVPAQQLVGRDYRDVGIWTLASCILSFVGTLALPLLGRLMNWGGLFVKVPLGLGFSGVLILGLFWGCNWDEAKRLIVLVILVLFNIFFWMGFEQAGGTMTLFAEEKTALDVGPVFLFLMVAFVLASALIFLKDTVGEKSGRILWWTLFAMFILLVLAMLGAALFCLVTGKTVAIPASQFQAINPLVIVAFAPTFSRMWESLDKTRFRLSIPAKMAVGMIVLGLGFVLLYAGQRVGIASGSKISPMWLIAVYFIHTIGELCLSPVGLSMVTKLAPPRTASLAMGVWLGSSAIANYLAGILESSLEKHHVPIFAFLIASSILPALVLLIITPLLKWAMGKAAY